MPIYEYRCRQCGRRFSIFFKRMGADEGVSCPKCGTAGPERLFSRFALARSEEERLDRLADSDAFSGVDENDPKSLAQAMRKMGKEMGEDGGPEFEQAVQEIEQMDPSQLASEMGEGGEDAMPEAGEAMPDAASSATAPEE